eukprot:COSAG02_NODE_20558_length_825_cov_3.670799_1_plen_24_part_01
MRGCGAVKPSPSIAVLELYFTAVA